MIQITATRNGGGTKWTNTFEDLNKWIDAVRESHSDDQEWQQLDERVAHGDHPTTEEWAEVANSIVESAESVSITVEVVA